ncbi:transmembrane amino acid transporter protein-domain-containing protein [Mycotypha africana]|uniref:transmembrane amino acid transporter protein-domain-containing protein n=1 Tax=Mycotypha africana TaxID=64632 RepID=UPI002300BB81|nr:transmembrane amino acid transporter protein-domain-containing protein [Mycotypha africana]KAI8979096.1 transmembrane amino acid transporter protein-domain-containing protein [Mycotypha africana]
MFTSLTYSKHAPEGTATSGKALFMLLKAFVGTGVVFLPRSFASGGLILSICLMIVIASICSLSFHILIKAQQSVGGSYGEVARTLYGNWLYHLIDFFLCISQMVFVASYLIFISENIGLAVQTLNHCVTPFDARHYIWVVLIVVIPITWIRKIAKLSYLAIIADIFILFGLACVVYFSSTAIVSQRGPGPNLKFVDSSSFGLMIGTAVFSFEGIGMVVPIVEGMKEPHNFGSVLLLGMVICTSIFVFIGSIGYIAYGDRTQASVVANMPREPLSITVQLLYSLAMILSSPFMLYPPLTIIEHALFKKHRSDRTHLRYKWLENFTRSLIPLTCAAISFGVGADGLDKFVSLVGSIACMPLCFIFPGMFHYKITRSSFAKFCDVILILWGVGIEAYTLYININSWIAITPPSSSTSITNNSNVNQCIN